jgi:hypothetical protein
VTSSAFVGHCKNNKRCTVYSIEIIKQLHEKKWKILNEAVELRQNASYYIVGR